MDPSRLAKELRELTELRHSDPHRLLGVHAEGSHTVIRAFRPDATSVEVVLPTGKRPMEARGGGLFEATLPDGETGQRYLLEVSFPRGGKVELQDPYRFLPTLGELDLHFAGEGRHERLWDKLGAHLRLHDGVPGVAFAVWAPTAAGVSIVGDFNSWDGRLNPMRQLGSSGIWELFVPGVAEGTRYKFEVRPRHGGPPLLKADPLAFRTEVPPASASVVCDLGHFRWDDAEWIRSRDAGDPRTSPVSIYEVHLASWRRVPEDGGRPLSYREAAHALGDYALRAGFTHVELLPIAEHPFGGSWGYQVASYYAPTARFGHPDDFRYLVNHLHQLGLGVIVDWVPGHFPRDSHALGRFDGTAVYEHEDPRQGEHPDWGTFIFNFDRHEVRNFLVANALFWLEEYHVDGLRVDAVASMLYLDYSRKAGQWIPNASGGRENNGAIAFLRELNTSVSRKHPGALMIAEESTAWPKVSQPPESGGLGFRFKWNMGWMHDTLLYFHKDPVFRRYHHNQLTFGLLYAFTEQFVLPLSHDEVVHGKGSLLSKMPGDEWQRFANLRALYAWMWAMPGKKLLFMGGEIGQWAEWSSDKSLDWHLLEGASHTGVQKLVSDLNAHYQAEPALFSTDGDSRGFFWLQADEADTNTYAFVRRTVDGTRFVACLANLSPVPRQGYRVGLPVSGPWEEILNTDSTDYGGSGLGNLGRVEAENSSWNGQPASAQLTLPPLAVLWLRPATAR